MKSVVFRYRNVELHTIRIYFDKDSADNCRKRLVLNWNCRIL